MPSNPTTRANARLTAAVKADPTSISAWLELLEHSVAAAPTSAARSDIALNVLDKAFSAHPLNRRDPTLRLRYLLSGADIWSATKLEEEWERALKLTEDTPLKQMADLWMDYLSWRLKVGGVKGLEAAVQRAWSAVATERPGVTLLLFQLRVMWRCCIAISEAGTFGAQFNKETR